MPLWRIISGAILFALTVVAPGLLLVEVLVPALSRGVRTLAGVATGVLVLPTAAFGTALLLRTNLQWPLLALVAVAVSVPCVAVLRHRSRRAAELPSHG